MTNCIKIFDSDGKLLAIIPYIYIVNNIFYSHDNKHIVVISSGENHIKIFSTADYSVVQTIYCYNFTKCFGYSHNDKYIVISEEKIIKYCMFQQEIYRKFNTEVGITSITCSLNDEYIVVGYLNGHIEIWDTALGIFKNHYNSLIKLMI